MNPIKVKKIKVCRDCLSPYITDVNCICVVDNRRARYIELEFEYCTCCGRTSDDYAMTVFNERQLSDNCKQ